MLSEIGFSVSHNDNCGSNCLQLKDRICVYVVSGQNIRVFC